MRICLSNVREARCNHHQTRKRQPSSASESESERQVSESEQDSARFKL